MENTSSRRRDRSNRKTPVSSHRGSHLASRPSSAGFSGRRRRAESRLVSGREESGITKSYYNLGSAGWATLLGRRFDAIDLLLHEPLGGFRNDLAHRLADHRVGETIEHALSDFLHQ